MTAEIAKIRYTNYEAKRLEKQKYILKALQERENNKKSHKLMCINRSLTKDVNCFSEGKYRSQHQDIEIGKPCISQMKGRYYFNKYM